MVYNIYLFNTKFQHYYIKKTTVRCFFKFSCLNVKKRAFNVDSSNGSMFQTGYYIRVYFNVLYKLSILNKILDTFESI